MADKQEYEFPEINASFVRTLDAAGNSGKTKLENLFKSAFIVRQDVPLGADFNNVIANGVYNIVNPTGLHKPGFDYGLLCVFGDVFYVQIAFNYFGSPVYRMRENNGNWNEWRNL